MLAGEERGDSHGVAWLGVRVRVRVRLRLRVRLRVRFLGAWLGYPAWRCLLPHLAWGEG